jgi:type II secretory pathway component PulJ
MIAISIRTLLAGAAASVLAIAGRRSEMTNARTQQSRLRSVR